MTHRILSSSMVRSCLSLLRTSRTLSLSRAWSKLKSIIKQQSVIMCITHCSSSLSASLCFTVFFFLFLSPPPLLFNPPLAEPRPSSLQFSVAETRKESYIRKVNGKISLLLIGISAEFPSTSETSWADSCSVSTWMIQQNPLLIFCLCGSTSVVTQSAGVTLDPPQHMIW